MKLRLLVVALIFLFAVFTVSEWLHWEVERSFINWERRKLPFPSPFYIIYLPAGVWEDLAITLSLASSTFITAIALVISIKYAKLKAKCSQ